MRLIIILLALLTVSCSSALPSLKPYRMDIQQGNVVTSKMIMQLRPGMTKSQVRFIMGTPLIQDAFHSNRWDYFYQMRQDGKIIEQRRVILEFENDALAKVRGDVIPVGDGQQDLATPASTPESRTIAGKAKPKAKDEKGLVDRLKFWKSDEVPQKVEATDAGAEAAKAELPAAAAAVAETAESVAPTAATPSAEPKVAVEPTESAPSSVQVEAIDTPEPVAAPSRLPEVLAPTEAASGGTVPDKAVETVRPSEPVKAVAPVKAAPATVVPSAPASAMTEQSGVEAASGADDMMLRLDRTINLPMDDANPSNVSNPSKAPDADLPSEASPDFFERMLEKIGF